MHLSLGGIVKGITTGLETLAETGNPFIAAGAGAVACLSDKSGGQQSSPSSVYSPLLDELSANTSADQHNVNALSSFADLIADAA
jgi:hypothetical protein